MRNRASGAPPPPKKPLLVKMGFFSEQMDKTIKAFCLKHFLPLGESDPRSCCAAYECLRGPPTAGFLFALFWSLVLPQPGRALASWKIGSYKVIQVRVAYLDGDRCRQSLTGSLSLCRRSTSLSFS